MELSTTPAGRGPRTLSAAEVLAWRLEADPVRRGALVILLQLDRPPSLDRIVARLEHLGRRHSWLRQRVKSDSFSIGCPSPARRDPPGPLDLDRHLDRWPHGATTAAAAASSLDLAAQRCVEPFTRDAPPWRVSILGSGGGGVGPAREAALMLEVHPTLAGGELVSRMLAELCDFERDGRARPGGSERGPSGAPQETPGWLASVGEWLSQPCASVRRELAPVPGLLGGFPIVRHALGPTRGRERCFASFDLAPVIVRREALRSGGAFTPTLTVMAATALLRHLAARGGTPRTMTMRLGIPSPPLTLEVRVGDEAGDLTMRPSDDQRRLRKRVAQVLAAPPACLASLVAGAVAEFRLGFGDAERVAALARADLAVGSLSGPVVPAYVAGSRVEAVAAFPPLAGAAMGAGLVSYAGRATVGLSIDPAAIDDPAELLRCFTRVVSEAANPTR